jgi:thiamine-phosphate pyrophosphorylase
VLRRPLDLYVIVDTAVAGDRDPVALAAAAIAGGATALQLRAKDLPTVRQVAVARALADLARRHAVLFIVNDRLDVALAVEADGVHLGWEDLPPADARRLLGPERVLGVSAGNLEEARAALAAGADYLGVGPIFPTRTKADAGEAIGLEGLRAIRALSSVPIVAIGGITAENAAAVIAAGADGVAVISAVLLAPDPTAAARRLRQVIDEARRARG